MRCFFKYPTFCLQDYINEISNDPVKSKICKQRVLSRTLAGNLVYILTITSPSKKPDEYKVSEAHLFNPHNAEICLG